MTCTVALECHASTPMSAVRSIDVRVDTCGDLIALHYRVRGELERLRIPAPRAARLADRLWQHTCFEAFVARRDTPAYHELNFSPSGEWAAYAFEDYRVGRAVTDEALEPQVAVGRDGEDLELTGLVRLACLSAEYAGATILLGLSAVIEERGGALSYWALAHPAGSPDFHHRDAFALELTAS